MLLYFETLPGLCGTFLLFTVLDSGLGVGGRDSPLQLTRDLVLIELT